MWYNDVHQSDVKLVTICVKTCRTMRDRHCSGKVAIHGHGLVYFTAGHRPWFTASERSFEYMIWILLLFQIWHSLGNFWLRWISASYLGNYSERKLPLQVRWKVKAMAGVTERTSWAKRQPQVGVWLAHYEHAAAVATNQHWTSQQTQNQLIPRAFSGTQALPACNLFRFYCLLLARQFNRTPLTLAQLLQGVPTTVI